MNVLVTGGAGYIGSHTVVSLLDRGDNVIIIDNLVNSTSTVIERIEKITNKRPTFYEADIRDEATLDKLFDSHAIDAVIHFAGLKAVGESVAEPLRYYRNNLESTLILLETMRRHNVKNLVFSSSATVYGDPATLPITEDMFLSATNPYGQTKLMIERILLDTAAADEWHIISLRYFNPIGAHQSGLIGENPNGPPNNLLPYISQVAIGKRKKLAIFGDDYNTSDGTGVRDYIHILDLADAHIAALKHLPDSHAYRAINVGTGKGISVLELVRAFENACGKRIPYEVTSRRAGDIASCYADVNKATQELEWTASRTIMQACEDTWRWQSQNPSGYN